MKKQINVRVPDKTVQEIDFLAEFHGLTKTQVVIMAVKRWARTVKRQQAEKGKE